MARPVAARSPARPCSHTAAATLPASASAATSAAVMPVSTSPVPPVASAAEPVGLTHTRPSGAATRLPGPLATITAHGDTGHRAGGGVDTARQVTGHDRQAAGSTRTDDVVIRWARRPRRARAQQAVGHDVGAGQRPVDVRADPTAAGAPAGELR